MRSRIGIKRTCLAAGCFADVVNSSVVVSIAANHHIANCLQWLQLCYSLCS